MTAAPFPPAVAKRLAKICGLLGSDHPGEVANAGQAGTRLLSDHGWTWEALVLSATTTAASPLPVPLVGWRAAVAVVAGRPDLLTAWEAKFITDLSRCRQPALSPKQLMTLTKLHGRVLAAGSAR